MLLRFKHLFLRFGCKREGKSTRAELPARTPFTTHSSHSLTCIKLDTVVWHRYPSHIEGKKKRVIKLFLHEAKQCGYADRIAQLVNHYNMWDLPSVKHLSKRAFVISLYLLGISWENCLSQCKWCVLCSWQQQQTVWYKYSDNCSSPVVLVHKKIRISKVIAL